jgi:hypothetical protein
MDSELILAIENLQKELACSADEIVCDPELRTRFLEMSRNKGVFAPEKEVLHRLLNLRKRKRLPRIH